MQRGGRGKAGGGIFGVVAKEDFGKQRAARGIGGEYPHRVEGGRLGQDTSARDCAEGRLEPGHAAIGCGPDNGAAGLGADGKGHHPGGHGSRRTLRRAARRMSGVMGVRRLSRVHEGKFGRDRLAHDDCAFPLEPFDDESVPQGHAALVTGGAVLCRDALGVDHILQADGQPVQPAKWSAGPAIGVERAGLGPGEVRIEPGPGANLFLSLLDPRDAAFHEGQCIECAAGQPVAQLGHADRRHRALRHAGFSAHRRAQGGRRRWTGRCTSEPSTRSHRRGTA